MAAPIRRPVKEPGPDMKVISLMSCQSQWFSWSLSESQPSSFSARVFPNSCWYSWLSSLRMIIGDEVSRYIFIG